MVDHEGGNDQLTTSRNLWESAALRLISGARPYATPKFALYHLPGPGSSHGRQVDGLEGFARVGLLKAFYIAGVQNPDLGTRLANEIAQGLVSGLSGEDSAECWPRINDSAQVAVEAASISLLLRIAGPSVWDLVPDETRTRLKCWFEEVLLTNLSENNWQLFHLVISDSLYGLWGDDGYSELHARVLDRIDEWYVGGGWYSDGAGRVFDYYNSYAFHFYPILSSIYGGREIDRDKYGARLELFLEDFQKWFGADGSPLAFGRSLTYRYATVASFSVAGLLAADSMDTSHYERLMTKVLRFFNAFVPDNDLLELGWHGPDRTVVQSYSGPASSYWASKAFACLLIPAFSKFWTGSENMTTGAFQRSAVVAVNGTTGMMIQRDRTGSIVRAYNHGSHNARSWADYSLDSDRLYDRIGYSNYTVPNLQTKMPGMGIVFEGVGRRWSPGLARLVGYGENFAVSEHSIKRTRIFFPTRLGRRPLAGIYQRLPRVARSFPVQDSKVWTATIAREGIAIHIVWWPSVPAWGRVVFGGWPLRDGERAGNKQELPRYRPHGRFSAEVGSARSDAFGLLGFDSGGIFSTRSSHGRALIPFLRSQRLSCKGSFLGVAGTSLSHISDPEIQVPSLEVSSDVNFSLGFGSSGNYHVFVDDRGIRIDEKGSLLSPLF